MKANLRSGIVLALVAGCACSVAMAQPTSGRRHQVEMKSITKVAQAPEPLYIEVGGVRYPYHDLGGSDDNFNIYQNGVGTTAHTAWTTAAAAPNAQNVLDDISFVGSYGAGAGRLINRMTLNITTQAAAPSAPLTGVDVVVTLWDGFNAAGTPLVNTGIHTGTPIRFAFPAPASPGWAANTIYFRDVDLSTLPGGGIQTTSDSFAMQFQYLQTGLNPPFYHPDLALGFETTGVENGSSQDQAYDDTLSTLPQGTFFDTSDAFQFTDINNTPIPTNAAIALRANVTLPTGACCNTDGSCDVLHNIVSCATVGGVYRGDGSSCAAANCPPPGACCRSSGTCSSITAAACASAGGVYRGDGSCCGTANCPVGFDAGPPHTLLFNGVGSALGFSSGNLSAAQPNRWILQAFTMSKAATINEIDVDFFVPAGNEFLNLQYSIYTRVPGSPQAWAAPTGANVVATGSVPFSAAALLADPRAGQTNYTQFAMTGLNVALPAGDYYLTIYPGAPDPATNTTGVTNAAWFTNAQQWSAIGNTPIYNFDTDPNPDMAWRSNTLNVFPIYRQPTTVIDVNPAPTFGPIPQSHHYVYNTSFIIKTAPQAACYANCDQSTQAPVLNVLDFSCFLNKFAAGDCYANCDASTQPPVLNVLDFSCFLNRFAAGCT